MVVWVIFKIPGIFGKNKQIEGGIPPVMEEIGIYPAKRDENVTKAGR